MIDHIDAITNLMGAFPYISRDKTVNEIMGIIKSYSAALQDIAPEKLDSAITRAIAESKYFPSIAELRGYAGKPAPVHGKGRQQVAEATDEERDAVYAHARERIKNRNWDAPDKVKKRIRNAEAMLARGIPGQAKYWNDYIAYQRSKLA